MIWGIITLLIISAYIGVSLLLPATITIASSLQMSGEAEDIYKRIENFNNWSEWAIWNDDQSMNVTISNPPKGIGARYRWKSKIKDIKDGLIILIDAQPSNVLAYEFYYSKSKRGQILFNLKPQDAGTSVTCSITINNKKKIFSRYFLMISKKGIAENIDEVLLKIDGGF